MKLKNNQYIEYTAHQGFITVETPKLGVSTLYYKTTGYH
jgi:hypothetical protein